MSVVDTLRFLSNTALSAANEQKRKREEREEQVKREVEQFSSLAKDVAKRKAEQVLTWDNRTIEDLPPEVKDYWANRRFIPVGQGDLGRKQGEPERIEIQDLRGARTSSSLLSASDIMGEKGDALTAQSQMSLELGKKMRQREAEEAKKRIIARSGQERFDQIQQENKRRAQDKIAELDRKWAERRAARSQMREEIEKYKKSLNENIYRNAGRAYGRYVKPWLHPVAKAAAPAVAVVGGLAVYDNMLKPDTPVMNVPRGSVPASQMQVPRRGTTQPAEQRPRRSRSGYSNTIVPVKKPTSADYAAYGADVRSPGGAVGAQRRREGERLWGKWQEEDRPKREMEERSADLERRKADFSTKLAASQRGAEELMASSQAEIGRIESETARRSDFARNFQNQMRQETEAKNRPVANQPLELGQGETFKLQQQQDTANRRDFAANFRNQMGQETRRRKEFAKNFQSQMADMNRRARGQ